MFYKSIVTGYYLIRGYIHFSSIGFAIMAAYSGNWAECFEFALFAAITA